MADTVEVSAFSDAMVGLIKQYTTEVEEGVVAAVKDTADETQKVLKSISPVGATKRYSRGWRVHKTGPGAVTVYNSRYQLTHLLEKGHAKRGGGRVAAIPHIQPAQDFAEKQLLKRIGDAIQEAAK